MATIEFTIKMNCGVGRDEDADLYVSHCPTLDIYSQGESEEEALEAIKSAVTMHLTTAFDFNRLDKVLRKAGFHSTGSAESAPPEECEFVQVNVQADPKMKQVPITLPVKLVSPQREYASAG